MPYVKNYIHFVWSTKNRQPFLNSLALRVKVWDHIRENAKSKGLFVVAINGYADHCHCLVSMGIDQTMSKVMQLIKGESSYWINKQSLCSGEFEWQDEYFAYSVSPSMLARTKAYIHNQEDHHKLKTFQDDYVELMNIYDTSRAM